jgi:hypothetical protein
VNKTADFAEGLILVENQAEKLGLRLIKTEAQPISSPPTTRNNLWNWLDKQVTGKRTRAVEMCFSMRNGIIGSK